VSNKHTPRQLEQSQIKTTTSTCFRLTTLALTLTDIRHWHQHRGGMSKKHATDRVENSATVTTLETTSVIKFEPSTVLLKVLIKTKHDVMRSNPVPLWPVISIQSQISSSYTRITTTQQLCSYTVLV